MSMKKYVIKYEMYAMIPTFCFNGGVYDWR